MRLNLFFLALLGAILVLSPIANAVTDGNINFIDSKKIIERYIRLLTNRIGVRPLTVESPPDKPVAHLSGLRGSRYQPPP